ncbi:hypothetical protein CEXT_771861, partial [Caerostris extrusa]
PGLAVHQSSASENIRKIEWKGMVKFRK